MQTRRSKRGAPEDSSVAKTSSVNATAKATAASGVKSTKKQKTTAPPKTATAVATSKGKNDTEDAGPRTSVWLMKSEPDTFSIDDLANKKDSESWDGVRNHEARNLMRDMMKMGDTVLFYHSNTKEPGIVGIAKIVRESYPDHTAFDPKSPYFDPKSSKDAPRWFMVDVKFTRKLKRILTLKELQQFKDKELKDMKLLNRGRLSVQPVSDKEVEFIMALEQKNPKDE